MRCFLVLVPVIMKFMVIKCRYGMRIQKLKQLLMPFILEMQMGEFLSGIPLFRMLRRFGWLALMEVRQILI
ncbi:hypothetical protein D3C78_1708900 [compost metagenome]